jgi:DNA-binding MurR/RpiR family transcriptional regulator
MGQSFQDGCQSCPFHDTWQRIDDRFDGLPPQLQRGARFVRENPHAVALDSLRALAGKANVSPSAMTRLVQAIGFGSYEAFQSVHRDWLIAGRQAVFSRRADKLVTDAKRPGGDDELIDALVLAESANVSAGLGDEHRGALRDAADMLAAAPAITILGIRSCFPIAFNLHYALSLFRANVRIMMGAGGSLLDDLHLLRRGDVLVAASVTPYSRETVDAARFAQRTGVSVICITDGPLTPLARASDVVLTAANESPAHIASPIGPLAVAHALAALVLARAGDGALEELRRREATFEATAAYLPEEQPS